MNCLAPIIIPDKPLIARGVKNAFIKVPCGHCVECARDRRNDWFVRLWSTYNRCKSLDIPVWFVTITIDPFLWPNMNISNPDIGNLITPFVRSWNERFRYLNNGKMPLRFICSEFGSRDRDYIDYNGVTRVTTGALHFHGLIFGFLPLSDLIHGLQRTHGYVQFDRIKSPRAIRYVVKYCTKDYSVEDPKLRARTFCSPGIGDSTFYFKDQPATKVVLINGFHYRTPRYFIDSQWLYCYSVSHSCDLRTARKNFHDSAGRSAIVNENIRSRYKAYVDFCNYFYSLSSESRKLFLSSLAAKKSDVLSYDDVVKLCTLKRVGLMHPTLRHHSLVFLDREFYNICSCDYSFNSVKPFNNNFYERSQIVFPLSFNFET